MLYAARLAKEDGSIWWLCKMSTASDRWVKDRTQSYPFTSQNVALCTAERDAAEETRAAITVVPF